MSFQNRLQTILITLLLGAILHKANAGPDNIAYKAKATGSASIDDNAKPDKVIDGVIKILGQGEWISNSGMTFWGAINYP